MAESVPYVTLYMLMTFVLTVHADELVVPERSLLLEYEADRAVSVEKSFPFTIRSSEQGDALAANVLMKIPVSYEVFRNKLSQHRKWCEFLILHLNIKSCVAERRKGQDYLVLYAGRKHYQPPEITYKLQYRFRLLDNRSRYFEVMMDAPSGPLSTRNYRIHLRAIPYKQETLIGMGLYYEQSFISRAATYSYLTTLGRNKVGFSLEQNGIDESPEYIGGVKAVIERNVMRYFLAMRSYLQASNSTEQSEFNRLLVSWYTATEEYHRQLYEYEQETYVDAKHKEYLNQRQLQLQIDKKATEKH